MYHSIGNLWYYVHISTTKRSLNIITCLVFQYVHNTLYVLFLVLGYMNLTDFTSIDIFRFLRNHIFLLKVGHFMSILLKPLTHIFGSAPNHACMHEFNEYSTLHHTTPESTACKEENVLPVIIRIVLWREIARFININEHICVLFQP